MWVGITVDVTIMTSTGPYRTCPPQLLRRRF
jgi:hypothetical protein